jgi:hypothetical protein
VKKYQKFSKISVQNFLSLRTFLSHFMDYFCSISNGKRQLRREGAEKMERGERSKGEWVELKGR